MNTHVDLCLSWQVKRHGAGKDIALKKRHGAGRKGHGAGKKGHGAAPC